MEVTPLELEGFVPYPPEIAARYRSEGHWIDQTLSEPLFASAERLPDKLAVVSGETQLSYAQLADRVLRVAAGLADIGIARGDRAIVHLPNIAEFIVFVHALWELGAIPVFAPGALRRTEIEHFIERTDARAYVTVARHGRDDLAALAAELKQKWLSLEHTIVLDADGGGVAWAGLLEYEPIAHERRSAPQDVGILQMSGGTTGLPKLVPHTHEAYTHSISTAVSCCAIDEGTVQLIPMPIAHNMSARSPGFLGVISAGGTVVLAPDGSPDTVFPLIQAHGVTQASIVPPLLMAWLNTPLRDQFDLSSLHSLHVAGAVLSVEVARRVRPELGVILQQGYGMSEGFVAFMPLGADDEVAVCAQGKPSSPGDELLILDDEGREVSRGQVGHLLTRGPGTIRGFWRAPEMNAENFTVDGFYRTGDIVRWDERGFVTMVGRSKDQINRGGEKVSPAEVENLLLVHEAVHDASVVGVPDDVLGERVKAFVVPRSGADRAALTLASIRRHLRERGLASHKMPEFLEVVSDFPRTAVGKVNKRDLARAETTSS